MTPTLGDVSASSAFLATTMVYSPSSMVQLPSSSPSQRRRSRTRNGSSAVTVSPAGTLTRAKLWSSFQGRSPTTPSGLGGGLTNSIATSSPSTDDVLVMSTLTLNTAFLATLSHGSSRLA